MAEIREQASKRLAAIRQAQKDGSLGPFAPDPKPKNSQKLSPLAEGTQTMKANQDRVKQEQELGMTRGRGASYKGD